MLAIKKSQKIAKNRNIYECKICDYNTCNKYDFNKHIKTIKHKECELSIKSNDLAMFLPQKSQESKFTCQNCDKKYKDYSGLWRHKKICIQQNDTLDDSIDDSIDESIDITDKDALILHLLKQNGELQKSLIEISKDKSIINTTNNNSHNKTFNLNFFLNETCKDALNIQEFVSSIKPSIEDLENTGRRGYIEGISNIILKGLNKLEQHFRPIHCSDQKREILYIKDDNQWIKESEDKPILTKAIKIIANENIKKIKEWKDSNPDCMKSDSKKNNLYLKIVSNSMNGSTEEEGCKNMNKIISNVVKETIIQKDS